MPPARRAPAGVSSRSRPIRRTHLATRSVPRCHEGSPRFGWAAARSAQRARCAGVCALAGRPRTCAGRHHRARHLARSARRRRAAAARRPRHRRADRPLELVRLASTPPGFDVVVVDTAPLAMRSGCWRLPRRCVPSSTCWRHCSANTGSSGSSWRVRGPDAADRLIAGLEREARDTHDLLLDRTRTRVPLGDARRGTCRCRDDGRAPGARRTWRAGARSSSIA